MSASVAGDEPAVPGKDRIGLGDTGHALERTTSESLGDLSEGGSFRIGKPHPDRKMRSEDPIFGSQIFILEQQHLIDHPIDVHQQSRRSVVRHEEHQS